MSEENTGIVPIHGKDYQTVALRIQKFREKYADRLGITTEVLHQDDIKVIVRAQIVDGDGRVVSSGLSEEVRASSRINATSAMENCETSAVGRSLAFIGLAGTEIASADEMGEAVIHQEANEFLDYMDLVRTHIHSISGMTLALDMDEWSAAKESWDEVDVEDKAKLWKATTKGGIFTTKQREKMKTTEFRTGGAEA